MSLRVESVDPDPIVQFRSWYDEAQAAGVRQPDAMTIATITPEGGPDARTVLLRGLDERGFTFYTNLESSKARDLAQHPRAALVFHWREIERQVRVNGVVDAVSNDETEAYWATRPRGHRISAWASPQSEVIDPEALVERVAVVEARFANVDPPLPPFWGGYRVAPEQMEFWQSRADRLHDRVRYRRVAARWVLEQLAP